MPVVMHTGSGNPLTTQSAPFTPVGSILNLDFGFATDEHPQPGLFVDSFTISITGPNGTGYLVTLDAYGTHWTPMVAGALPVDISSLQWQPSPFLVPTEGLTNLTAYAVAYSLPANLQNGRLTINFDLFDNQNAIPSLGYYSLPVPEPSAAALLVLAFVLWRAPSSLRAW